MIRWIPLALVSLVALLFIADAVNLPAWASYVQCKLVTNAGCLNVASNWTAHQGVSPVALTDGSSITVNGTDANSYTLTVAGNSHTLACLSTISYGAYNFRFLNSGGATGFAVASCYKFAGGTAPSWSSTNGLYDTMTCMAFDNARLECGAVINAQ